jgi:rRNA maturation RNase YbeY
MLGNNNWVNNWISWFVREQKWYRIKKKVDFIPGMILKDRKLSLFITLTNDEGLLKINKEYRQSDEVSSMLIIPSEKDIVIENIYVLGNMVLSYNSLISESKHLNRTTKYHCQHLLIEGVFDLLDYHENSIEVKFPRNIEDIISQISMEA